MLGQPLDAMQGSLDVGRISRNGTERGKKEVWLLIRWLKPSLAKIEGVPSSDKCDVVPLIPEGHLTELIPTHQPFPTIPYISNSLLASAENDRTEVECRARAVFRSTGNLGLPIASTTDKISARPARGDSPLKLSILTYCRSRQDELAQVQRTQHSI